ncbi:hypothetical protein C8F04DRAFT_1391837 [Mycena alexandri]|uniref:Uncharacterized protein n=1 Tax=Mycena alexandri TaxID=1745969 RepID=A0AAD6T8J0_9AGAR|nr:hypothetical protein C8F04DRAFT_1391837 [Mycena alexandri]
MNRPRPSVLQLFDPLTTRDAHSPDSDKENTLPDFDFFPQTWVQHPSPVRLTRRLVEVGDVTVDAAEDNENAAGEEEDDENDTVGIHPLSSPRTPLGDVTFDRERTPMRSKMYRRKAAAGEMAVSNAATDDYAFASVMGAVTASGGTLDEAPLVVICPPEDNHSSPASDTDILSASLATLSLATPTGSLIADTTMAFPTPSEASPLLLLPIMPPPSSESASTTSFNFDRSSADLQTSFALHMNMNSDDTSFDLLNDRISFLGFGDEESFDMGKQLDPIPGLGEVEETGISLLAQSGERLVEPSLVVSPVDTEALIPRSGSPPPASSSPPFSDVLHETLDTVHQHPCASSVIPLQPSFKSPVPPVFVAPPAAKQCSPLPVLSTSLPEPPAFIPALKIVKRKRPDTTTVPNIAAENHPLEKTIFPHPPTAARSVHARVAPSVAPPVGRYVMEGPGPWRVPLSISEKDQAPVDAKPPPGPALSGPRRVPLPTQAPAPAASILPPPPTKALSQIAQSTSTLGLKRPLRAVPPNGSVSGLPRAVGGTSGSRLPMTKSKIPSAGGTGLPRRRA